MGLFDSWSNPGEFVGFDNPGVTATGDYFDFRAADTVDYTTGNTAGGSSIFGGNWLDNLSTLATRGLGVWQTIEQTNAQSRLAQQRLATERAQSQTGAAFWSTLQRFLPVIVLVGVGIVLLLIVRKK